MRIVQNDAFNAFVLDGKNVFVHTGTLMQANTPNEVIGVIAHETGHITGGHMAALRSRIAKDQTRALLAQILGIGLMVAGGVSGGDVGARNRQRRPGRPVWRQRSDHALAARRAAAQESAADQAGLTFLNATKQSGRGMLRRSSASRSRNTSRTRRRTPSPAAILSRPTVLRACASSSRRAPTTASRIRRSCSCATT